MCVSLTYPFVSEIEIPPCNVSSEAQSQIRLYCGDRCHRCSLKSLDLSNFFKPNEQKDLDIFCDVDNYFLFYRTTTVDIVPDFFTLTPSISHLKIINCDMSMFSLMKLLIELKPQSLNSASSPGLGSFSRLSSRPVTLFPVIHQTENCISLEEVRNGLKNIEELKFTYNNYRPTDKTNTTFLKILLSSMPMLKYLTLRGGEIIDLIDTDMPTVTYIELDGPDIAPDVIQCIGNRMKGLKVIYIRSIIYNSTRKQCSTEETPLSNVTTLHYSRVFRAVHLNFNMPNLKTLTISGINGSKILHMLQTNLPSVTELYLYYRDISSDVIVASAMKGLEHLHFFIILQQRRYQSQSSNLKDVFRNIKNTSLKMFIFLPSYRYDYEVIYLRHHGLQDLGSKTFSNSHYFQSVRYLDASFNNISTLYEGCFKGFNDLKELNISWNQINNISSVHMSGLYNLRVLCFAHNELKSLNLGCFENLTNLIELDISWNAITHINSSYFADLHNLQILQLSHNKLKTISDCLSEFISFSNEMTTLDMSHNYLSSVNSTQCKMTKLEHLYLQNNNYSNIAEIVEIIGFDIKYINLSSNPIGILERTSPPIHKETHRIFEEILNEVIISRSLHYSWTDKENYSITLKDVMTRPLKVNAKIMPWVYFEWLLFGKNSSQLKHSPIVIDMFNMSETYTTITATEALGAFPVIKHFSFNLGDQIYCGCEYITTYLILHVLKGFGDLTNQYYSNNWTCSGPWEFSGIPLLQAPQRMFKDCWQGDPEINNHCVSYTQMSSNKHILDCSTSGLKKLPKLHTGEFVPEAEVILMINNEIDDLCQTKDIHGSDVTYGFYFPIPPNVEVIDFRNNSLESICADFFRKLDHANHTHLRKIDLRQNQLTTLSKYVLNNQFNLDFIILLEGNRFLCTCDNIWLKDWIVVQPYEMLPDLKSVECRDENENIFVDMKVSDMKCNTTTMWQHVTIGLATTVGIFILIAVYLYRVKTKVKVWLYLKFGWHPLDKGDNDNDITDMDYDVFISYSHEDLEWVRENLNDFLQSDNLGYTVCLHERDWPVGVLITENILLSVKHSRRMIMVLSENYLNSEWCRMEFQAAHREMLEGRTKYLIMIAMEGFPLQQLPPEMDFYIKTHTYLEAGNNQFKERLIYAMPETPLTKIRELRMQTNLEMEMEVRAISRRRFPALFYRMFTYRDGRGDLPLVENEEFEEYSENENA